MSALTFSFCLALDRSLGLFSLLFCKMRITVILSKERRDDERGEACKVRNRVSKRRAYFYEDAHL